jgi:hypothetical protein
LLSAARRTSTAGLRSPHRCTAHGVSVDHEYPLRCATAPAVSVIAGPQQATQRLDSRLPSIACQGVRPATTEQRTAPDVDDSTGHLEGVGRCQQRHQRGADSSDAQHD